MTTMPDHLRHAQHAGKPHPDCLVCAAMAARRERMAGVPVRSADAHSVRAVGGFVQESARFVR